jgi:hypothetical protein
MHSDIATIRRRAARMRALALQQRLDGDHQRVRVRALKSDDHALRERLRRMRA